MDQQDNQSTHFDDLPIELFEIIFNFLSLREKLKLKDVSTLWSNKINHLRLKKLFLSVCPIESVSNLDKDRIENFQENLIQLKYSTFGVFFDKFKTDLFPLIKELSLFKIDINILRNTNDSNLNFSLFLNSFVQLSSLGVYDCKVFNLGNINIKTLKAFILKGYCPLVLVLKAPSLKSFKLKKVQISEQLDLTFHFPESIELLEIDEDFSILNESTFKNLKHLYVRTINRIRPSFLKNLPNLILISLASNFRSLETIYMQREELERNNLVIYFSNLFVDNLEPFRSKKSGRSLIDKLDLKKVCALSEDCSKLPDKLWYYKEISDLDSMTAALIPDEFWTKLEDIDTIYGYGIRNENQFIENVRKANFECLENLHISVYHMSARFAHKLSSVFPRLQSITLSEISSNVRNVNLDYLLKLSNLVKIDISFVTRIRYCYGLELASNVFDNLLFIEIFNLDSHASGWSIKASYLHEDDLVFFRAIEEKNEYGKIVKRLARKDLVKLLSGTLRN